MRRILVGGLLLLAGAALMYGAWSYWEVLTKLGILLLGVAIGGCLVAGLLALLWRPVGPAQPRHQANLPSPWERTLWR